MKLLLSLWNRSRYKIHEIKSALHPLEDRGHLYALSRLFGTTVDDILVGSVERDEGPSFSVLWGIHANRICKCIWHVLIYKSRN